MVWTGRSVPMVNDSHTIEDFTWKFDSTYTHTHYNQLVNKLVQVTLIRILNLHKRVQVAKPHPLRWVKLSSLQNILPQSTKQQMWPLKIQAVMKNQNMEGMMPRIFLATVLVIWNNFYVAVLT